MEKVDDIAGALLPGSVFQDRYRIERCLRAGGMGMVCEVTDLNTERRRALKTMLPGCVSDPGLRTRFKHEATITASVDSEHLVEIFDAGIDEATGMPFIVMELLKGEDLGDLLSARGRLAPAEVVVLLHQASQALDRTHAIGIVHRDLKPENLYLTRRDDGSARLRILDFGIAKLLTGSTRWKTTGVLGTPLYMSPEQALGAGSIGPAADIYALGQIAFTLLVGEAFWEAAARDLPSPVVLLAMVAMGADQTATKRASALGVELAPSLDAWFAKATAREPRERFETASELVEALAAALGVSLPNRADQDLPAVDVGAGVLLPGRDAPGTCSALSTDRASATAAHKPRWVPFAIGAVAICGIALAVFAVPRLRSRDAMAVPVEESAAASTESLPQTDAAPAVVVLPPEPAASDSHTTEPAVTAAAPPPPPPRTAPAQTSATPQPTKSRAPSVPPKEPDPPAAPSAPSDPSDLF